MGTSLLSRLFILGALAIGVSGCSPFQGLIGKDGETLFVVNTVTGSAKIIRGSEVFAPTPRLSRPTDLAPVVRVEGFQIPNSRLTLTLTTTWANGARALIKVRDSQSDASTFDQIFRTGPSSYYVECSQGEF